MQYDQKLSHKIIDWHHIKRYLTACVIRTDSAQPAHLHHLISLPVSYIQFMNTEISKNGKKRPSNLHRYAGYDYLIIKAFGLRPLFTQHTSFLLLLTLLQSERPELYTILYFLRAIGLRNLK